jgi:FeS assembly protein IscX
MPPSITWSDAEEIGIQLQEKFPETDPLTVRFTELHRYVTELENFADDPQKSNEGKLEAIQMAWYEEWKDQSRAC